MQKTIRLVQWVVTVLAVLCIIFLIGRITNYFFIYLIDVAEQLYKDGKIEMILISGDEHSLDGINEPECLRDTLGLNRY